MSRKRLASDRPYEETDEDNREVKKQKILPREAVMEYFLELSSSASELVTKFNKSQLNANRGGVGEIFVDRLQRDLSALVAASDVETLDTKLHDIDSYLERKEGLCRLQLANPMIEPLAADVLDDIINKIQVAKEQLPDIKTVLLNKPPPSEYAKAKNWVDLQNLPNPMLCMRPVSCRGLPIFLLHSVFATYLSLNKEPLSATPQARIALQVARALCNTMGNYFMKESARRSAFLQTLKPLFSRWVTTMEATSEGATPSTRTDTTISVNGTIMVFTEIKSGKNNGDAYMQASRGYEIATEALLEGNPNWLAHGAPTFLCCLDDEELRIAGAFKDGEQIVVEPLSLSLLYPDSRPDGRVMQLAQQLFALYSCVDIIAKGIMSPRPPPANTPGFPRVFPAVRNTETQQIERLEFVRLRKDLWETRDGTIDYLNLIFDATFHGKNVLAKVVFRSYEGDVHTHLATNHMAPLLFGTCDVQGIASAVVMELLEDGWVTLFDYRENQHRNGIPEDARSCLLKRIEEILDCLGTARMVHGDFRMANIMLKPGEEDKAVLIDFDWAGKVGRARYPVTRSDGYGYPGDPGGLIGAGDDRQFYETWKDKI